MNCLNGTLITIRYILERHSFIWNHLNPLDLSVLPFLSRSNLTRSVYIILQCNSMYHFERYIRNIFLNGNLLTLVSHMLKRIRNMCDRVVWLEKDKIVRDGNDDDICKAYLRSGNNA